MTPPKASVVGTAQYLPAERKTVNGCDERFAAVEGQISAVKTESNGRFIKLETQIAETDKRLGRIEQQLERGFAEMGSAYAALCRMLLAGAIVLLAALIGVIGALLA